MPGIVTMPGHLRLHLLQIDPVERLDFPETVTNGSRNARIGITKSLVFASHSHRITLT